MGWKFALTCIGLVGLAVHYATQNLKSEDISALRAETNTQSKQATAVADLAFSPWMVKEAVRRQLRDPESATFRDFTATNDRKIGSSPAGLVVCGYVNAKNGFGGYTGDKMFIDFYKPGLIDIEPTPRTKSFVASWNRLCAG